MMSSLPPPPPRRRGTAGNIMYQLQPSPAPPPPPPPPPSLEISRLHALSLTSTSIFRSLQRSQSEPTGAYTRPIMKHPPLPLQSLLHRSLSKNTSGRNTSTQPPNIESNTTRSLTHTRLMEHQASLKRTHSCTEASYGGRKIHPSLFLQRATLQRAHSYSGKIKVHPFLVPQRVPSQKTTLLMNHQSQTLLTPKLQKSQRSMMLQPRIIESLHCDSEESMSSRNKQSLQHSPTTGAQPTIQPQLLQRAHSYAGSSGKYILSALSKEQLQQHARSFMTSRRSTTHLQPEEPLPSLLSKSVSSESPKLKSVSLKSLKPKQSDKTNNICATDYPTSPSVPQRNNRETSNTAKCTEYTLPTLEQLWSLGYTEIVYFGEHYQGPEAKISDDLNKSMKLLWNDDTLARIPISELSHATHSHEAKEISKHRGYYTFQPSKQQATEKKRIVICGDNAWDTKDYYHLPGYHSWWGINLKKWYNNSREGQEMKNTIEVLRQRRTYVTQTLQGSSRYGGKAFTISFTDLVNSYIKSRQRGSTVFFLKACTLRYRQEMYYVIMVCMESDWEETSELQGMPIVHVQNGYYKCKPKELETTPLYFFGRYLIYEFQYKKCFHEEGAFAFYFKTAEEELRCRRDKVTPEEVTHDSPYCTKKKDNKCPDK